MKVYVFEHHNEQALSPYARRNKALGFQLRNEHLKHIKAVSKKVRVVKDVREAEVVIAARFSQIDFKACKKLRWVHLTSAGVGEIPNSLLNSDILLTNSSGVHPIPIAEQVLGYMLMFARGIPKTFRNQVKRRWVKDGSLVVFELSEKTVLIVGLGSIGRMIAQFCKAFRMRVLGVVREKERRETHVDRIVASKQLDQVLGEADFVINCLPGTEETYHLFNSNKFKKFKKGSYFINIGRGTSVDEKALIAALKSGKLAGAGLDVFEEEPLAEKSPLWNLENVIITPHIAGNTPFYMDRVVEIFCENLRAYLTGNLLPNLVDKNLGY